MADEKEKNEEVKVLGLDDEETPSEPSKLAKLQKLKKYLLPSSIGIGAVLLMVVFYFSFLSGDTESEKAEEPTEHQQEHARTSESKVVDKSDIDEKSTAKWKEEHVVDINEPGKAPQRIVLVDTVTFGKDDNKKEEEEEEKEKEEKEEKKPEKPVEPKIDTIRLTWDDYGHYEIDTVDIMKGLEFIFTTPQKEAALAMMSAQDSIDTLNWIEKKMLKLDNENKELDKKRKELAKLERRIDKSMIKIEQAESSRIIKLARLYDGMKAIEVSKLFMNLPDDIVVAIMPRMKPANAGKIMALMPPKRAARISTQMITVLEDN
jgi:flagellar motility protein MotE (MotC chaperone)